MKTDIFKMFTLSFFRRNILATLGILGLLFATLFSISYGDPKSNPPNQIASPTIAPFQHNVSGTGIIEPNTKSIEVSPFSGGVIGKIHVSEGEHIEKGAPLLTQDQEKLMVDVKIQEQFIEVVAARIEVAKVKQANTKYLLDRAEKLKSGFTIPEQELKQKLYDYQEAKAQLKALQSEYEKEKEQLNAKKVDLDRSIIRSPIKGKILKVSAKQGEYIAPNDSPQRTIIVGDINPLYVRVQVDENDVWRFQEKAKAIAYHKGNNNMSYPLKLIRVEPLLIQKRQLSGRSSELVDTRVLEVLYEISIENPKLFVGQQVDVFIESNQ